MEQKGLVAAVLSHVPFEDLGSLRPVLRERNFAVETIDAMTPQFPRELAERADLLIVLGGPIGVYETEAYPFLLDEIECVRRRLADKRPMLGICLGAQLMAAAAGARVYPGTAGAEIGWKPIACSGSGEAPAWFAPILSLPVFHWHGDTFDLPAGARPLARSDRYENQAFEMNGNALAVQFHPEVTTTGLERWYVGHAVELAKRGISVAELRAAGAEHAPRLMEAARMFWEGWLDKVLTPKALSQRR
jgi:GMP synthase (glutamine-hydrolysing)